MFILLTVKAIIYLSIQRVSVIVTICSSACRPTVTQTANSVRNKLCYFFENVVLNKVFVLHNGSPVVVCQLNALCKYV